MTRPDGRGFRADTRGISSGFIAFLAIIIVGALFFTMTNPAASEVFNMTDDQADQGEAKDAISTRETIYSNILYYIVALAGITITARAVFETRRP